MTKDDATKLVNRSVSIILSCKTMEQLINAVKYADLVCRKISKEIGLLNHTQFISITERSIGFAQCQVKWNIERLII